MGETETSHFWIGRFPSIERLAEYFAETYDDDDEGDATPISQFAQDQDETWYDHDYLEYVFGDAGAGVEVLVSGASYHKQWQSELAQRAAAATVSGQNTVVFISQDQIEHARSVVGDDYELRYVGTITYRI
jgi:hypothetical protein